MRRSFSNFYKLLDVDVEAHSNAIKQAYYRQAKKYHPDSQGTGNSEMFKKVTEAYKVLSNPELRRDYDNSNYVPPDAPPSDSGPTAANHDPFIRTHRFTEDQYQDFKGKVESLYSKAFDPAQQKKYKDFKREEFYETPAGPMTKHMRDNDRRDSNFGIFVYGMLAMIIFNALRGFIFTSREKELDEVWNTAYETELIKIKDNHGA